MNLNEWEVSPMFNDVVEKESGKLIAECQIEKIARQIVEEHNLMISISRLNLYFKEVNNVD